MSAPFESNLAALAARNASLVRRMKTAAESATPGIQIELSPSGLFGASAVSPDGTRIAISSKYNPQKEAARTVDAARLKPSAGVIAFGFGMGYHVIEISRRIGPGGFLAVVETDEDVLAAALAHTDFSPLFSQDNFRLFCGEAESPVDWLNEFVTEMLLRETTVFEHLPSLRLHPDEYRRAADIVQAAIDSAHSELVTKLGYAEDFFVNTWRNIPAILSSPGLESLSDRFGGRAAFTVAAGPSLDKNAAELARVPPGSLIICVGTALKVLLECGIVPHIVVAVDPQGKSARYFDCVEAAAPRPLPAMVCTTSASPAALEKFGGEKFFAWEDNRLCEFLSRFGGGHTPMKVGLSVAHTAFLAAQQAGCDPIVMLGQDLSFSGGRTHADGVEQVWGGAVDEGDSRFIRLPANDGGTVASLPVFRSFLAFFEMQIARCPARVINATAGGALIRGAEYLSLGEAVRLCGSGDSDPRDIISSVYNAADDSAFGALIETCEVLRTRAGLLKESALRAAEIARGRPGKDGIAEINDLLKEIVEDGQVMPLLEDVMIRTHFELKKKTASAPTRDEQLRRALTLAQGTAAAAAVLLDCISWLSEYEARAGRL